MSAKLWKRREGDEYVVIFAQIEGNPERGYSVNHYLQEGRYTSKALAISTGFDLRGSDDFNLGAIRGGKLVATLWMDEIVDDELCDVAQIAADIGVLA